MLLKFHMWDFHTLFYLRVTTILVAFPTLSESQIISHVTLLIFFYKLKNVIMCHMWRLTWQQNTKPCNNFFLLSYNIFESNPNLNALSIYMHLLWLLQIDISIEQRLRLWIVHTFVIIHAIMGVNGLDFFHLFKWFGFKIQTI